MSRRRVALVTGGARGIGAAICRRLARDGHDVAINFSSSADAAEQLEQDLRAEGVRTAVVRADVADRAEVDRAIDEVTASLGPPTILVCNAGVNVSGSVRSLPAEAWDRAIGVNLDGAFHCVHAALPAMYEAGWGRIVLLGSPSGGRHIAPTMSAYGAAKAGLVAFGAALAQEVARRGITVNTAVPGYVATDMTNAASDAAQASLQRNWPEVPASAVASLVAFLVSDDAAYISGEDIAVWKGGPIFG